MGGADLQKRLSWCSARCIVDRRRVISRGMQQQREDGIDSMYDRDHGNDGRKIFILEEMTLDQLSDFHMRLSENDVEYHDLKVGFCSGVLRLLLYAASSLACMNV